MATQTTDTRTGLFTKIPKSIVKRWSTKDQRVDLNSSSFQSGLHQGHALIREVILEIKFAPELCQSRTEYGDDDEESCEKVKAWNEAKTDYVALENALQTVIDTFSQRAIERAHILGQSSTETLSRKKTYAISTEKQKDLSSTTYGDYRATTFDYTSIPLNNRQRVETIDPRDSASNIESNITVRTAVRSKGAQNQRSNSSKQRSTPPPTSLLKFMDFAARR